jgi:hypothetical protein
MRAQKIVAQLPGFSEGLLGLLFSLLVWGLSDGVALIKWVAEVSI